MYISWYVLFCQCTYRVCIILSVYISGVHYFVNVHTGYSLFSQCTYRVCIILSMYIPGMHYLVNVHTGYALFYQCTYRVCIILSMYIPGRLGVKHQVSYLLTYRVCIILSVYILGMHYFVSVHTGWPRVFTQLGNATTTAAATTVMTHATLYLNRIPGG